MLVHHISPLPSTISSFQATSATWSPWRSLYVPKFSARPSRSPAGTSTPPSPIHAQFGGIVQLMLTLKQVHRPATCGNGSFWACLVSCILFNLHPYISNRWSHIAPQRINLPVRLLLSKRLWNLSALLSCLSARTENWSSSNTYVMKTWELDRPTMPVQHWPFPGHQLKRHLHLTARGHVSRFVSERHFHCTKLIESTATLSPNS